MKTIQKNSKQDKTDFGEFLRKLVSEDPELDEMVAEEETQLCLAEEIYRLRKERGLTQADLAIKIDTTQSVIARMEDADYDGHSLKMLQRIARALGVRFCAGFFAMRGEYESVSITQELIGDAEWPTVVPTRVD